MAFVLRSFPLDSLIRQLPLAFQDFKKYFVSFYLNCLTFHIPVVTFLSIGNFFFQLPHQDVA